MALPPLSVIQSVALKPGQMLCIDRCLNESVPVRFFFPPGKEENAHVTTNYYVYHNYFTIVNPVVHLPDFLVAVCQQDPTTYILYPHSKEMHQIVFFSARKLAGLPKDAAATNSQRQTGTDDGPCICGGLILMMMCVFSFGLGICWRPPRHFTRSYFPRQLL